MPHAARVNDATLPFQISWSVKHLCLFGHCKISSHFDWQINDSLNTPWYHLRASVEPIFPLLWPFLTKLAYNIWAWVKMNNKPTLEKIIDQAKWNQVHVIANNDFILWLQGHHSRHVLHVLGPLQGILWVPLREMCFSASSMITSVLSASLKFPRSRVVDWGTRGRGEWHSHILKSTSSYFVDEKDEGGKSKWIPQHNCAAWSSCIPCNHQCLNCMWPGKSLTTSLFSGLIYDQGLEFSMLVPDFTVCQ